MTPMPFAIRACAQDPVPMATAPATGEPVYRKLMPFARTAYADHLKRLSPQDRYARFTGAVTDATIDAHAAQQDRGRSRVLGAFVAGVLRGAVEISFDRILWPDNAELAVSVEAGFQNQGIGRELLRRGIVLARNRGAQHIHMLCLRSNRRMLALARTFQGQVAVEGQEATSAIVLDQPDPLSFMQEILDDGTGAFATWIEQLRPVPPRLAA